MIDSLPFAVNFSGRGGGPIPQIQSCSSFLLAKVDNDHIEWADNVRAGLAFKVNGRAVVKSFSDGIRLPTGQRIILSDDLICADGSGYTNPIPVTDLGPQMWIEVSKVAVEVKEGNGGTCECRPVR